MRLVVGVSAVIAALVAAGSTVGADTRVRPGKGIGKIDLGMTEAQVRARLGRPDFVHRRSAGFGGRYAELQYEAGYLIVGLLGRPGQLRVVKVSTVQRSERTPQGFGVGSLEQRLARSFGARLRCQRLQVTRNGDWVQVRNPQRECVVRGAAGGETVFVTRYPRRSVAERISPADWRAKAFVHEVVVRRTGFRG